MSSGVRAKARVLRKHSDQLVLEDRCIDDSAKRQGVKGRQAALMGRIDWLGGRGRSGWDLRKAKYPSAVEG